MRDVECTKSNLGMYKIKVIFKKKHFLEFLRIGYNGFLQFIQFISSVNFFTENSKEINFDGCLLNSLTEQTNHVIIGSFVRYTIKQWNYVWILKRLFSTNICKISDLSTSRTEKVNTVTSYL